MSEALRDGLMTGLSGSYAKVCKAFLSCARLDLNLITQGPQHARQSTSPAAYGPTRPLHPGRIPAPYDPRWQPRGFEGTELPPSSLFCTV